MFLVYLVLWLIFNERMTMELVAIGVVVSLLIDLFTWKILEKHHTKKSPNIKMVIGFIRYGWNLLCEIFKCNAAVMHLVLSSSLEVEPELHYFRTKLKSDAARVVLANSITLTPGTITCTLEDDCLCVHALDRQMAEGIEESDFEKRLLELEEIADES